MQAAEADAPVAVGSTPAAADMPADAVTEVEPAMAGAAVAVTTAAGCAAEPSLRSFSCECLLR